MSWNLPSVLLSFDIGRSPCVTWTSTDVWLSAAVENVSLLRVGIVVLRGISDRGDAAEGLDRERQRGHVEQQDVLDVARQHAALDRRTERDDLVGVDAPIRLAAEELLDLGLHHRDAGRATDQHDLVDVRDLLAGVRQCLLARLHRARDDVLDHLLELGARQLLQQVLGAGRVRREDTAG